MPAMILPSCRRRAPHYRARASDAEILQQAPGSPQRAADVRSGRRCRALSRIRAVVPLAEDTPAHAKARWHRDRDRRHDGVVQAGARSLHQPGDAGPSQPENSGRVPAGAVQQPREPLVVRAEVGQRLRCRIFPGLRIQEPDAGDADGNDVRHGVSAICRRIREARRCGLRKSWCIKQAVIPCDPQA